MLKFFILTLIFGASHALSADWVDQVAGNYYGGPPKCVISGNSNAPQRRCNCLSIKRLSDSTASVEFDRHDTGNDYACAGDGVAQIIGKSLVLCPKNEDPTKVGCVVITQDKSGIIFRSKEPFDNSYYCGRKAHVDGLRFNKSDRVQEKASCGI